MLWGERRENGIIVAATEPTGCPMPQPNDLSKSLAALDENSTLIAVIEMSQSSWLVAGRASNGWNGNQPVVPIR